MKKTIMALAFVATTSQAAIQTDLLDVESIGKKERWILNIADYDLEGKVLQNTWTKFVKKSNCILSAKNSWKAYWASSTHDKFTTAMICKSSINPYNFVKIECDESGSCNV